MATNPTKILLYDLDPELIKLVEQLILFQGSYTTLHERLMDLTPDTFDAKTQAVIEDLINSYDTSSVHMSQKLLNIKLELEAKMAALTYDSGNYAEHFTYDPIFGNVVKHEISGDKTTSVVYNYADVAAGKLGTSVQTFINTAGDTVKVTKTYTYDASENITDIATATVVTPAAAPAV